MEIQHWKKKAEEGVRAEVEGGPGPQRIDTRFHKLENHMPALLDEMQADLRRHPLFRKIIALQKGWRFNAESKDYFAYYFEEHPNLAAKMQILLNLNFIIDNSVVSTNKYIMTEDFAEYLMSRPYIPAPSTDQEARYNLFLHAVGQTEKLEKQSFYKEAIVKYEEAISYLHNDGSSFGTTTSQCFPIFADYLWVDREYHKKIKLHQLVNQCPSSLLQSNCYPLARKSVSKTGDPFFNYLRFIYDLC